MSFIEFKNVTKKYDAFTVIDHIDINIRKGDFVSFLGPSGCGKTTSLRILAGLEKNSSGTISIDSVVCSDPDKNRFIPPEKRHLGMVFQSYAVWPHMNVFDNVAFPLKMLKLPKVEIQNKVKKVLEIVELDHLHQRYSSELSGGQQQRVALARGLVMQPKALLLDEPLSNLDTKLREKMRKDIKMIQKEFNLTMIYVTHDQAEARTMSDQVVVMNKGRIEQSGSVSEIFSNPCNDFVAEFLKKETL